MGYFLLPPWHFSFSFSRRFADDLNFSGGGASVVYSDAIAAHGFSHELANYGEYSGAPTEGQTYEYAKTIIDLITRGTPHPEGKILIIGGGIANFTNVAATFKGIIRALKEYKAGLIAHSVCGVFVSGFCWRFADGVVFVV